GSRWRWRRRGISMRRAPGSRAFSRGAPRAPPRATTPRGGRAPPGPPPRGGGTGRRPGGSRPPDSPPPRRRGPPSAGLAPAPAAVPPGLAGLRRRALLLADAEAWPEVESTLDAALRLDATDPWTLDVLSDLLPHRPEMLAHLASGAQKELAAGSGGGDPTAALLVLARCHLLAGHTDQARAILERVAAARPTPPVPPSAPPETPQGAPGPQAAPARPG